RGMEQPGSLRHDARAQPGPGSDVKLGPGIEEPLVPALDLPEPLVLRAEGEPPPTQADIEAEDWPALVTEEAAHAGHQGQLDALTELEVPADQGRRGPDGFIVIAELEVERAVVRTGVDHPEVLRAGRDVPEERDPERPRRFLDRLGIHGLQGEPRR